MQRRILEAQIADIEARRHLSKETRLKEENDAVAFADLGNSGAMHHRNEAQLKQEEQRRMLEAQIQDIERRRQLSREERLKQERDAVPWIRGKPQHQSTQDPQVYGADPARLKQEEQRKRSKRRLLSAIFAADYPETTDCSKRNEPYPSSKLTDATMLLRYKSTQTP